MEERKRKREEMEENKGSCRGRGSNCKEIDFLRNNKIKEIELFIANSFPVFL